MGVSAMNHKTILTNGIHKDYKDPHVESDNILLTNMLEKDF